MSNAVRQGGLLLQARALSRPAKLFLLAVVIDGIVISAWWLFFNYYILASGFSREYLGLVTAASSMAAFLFGIPLGQLSDRMGRKRAMLLGVGVYTLACAVEVTVLNPTVILLTAFIGGAASMLYLISQAPFMMRVSGPHDRTLLFSLSFGLVTLSGAAGDLFAGQLPAAFASWLNVPVKSASAYQAVLLSATLFGSLALIPLLMIREPDSLAVPPSDLKTRLAVSKVVLRPLTIKLALPNLLIGFGAAILIPYMNVFLLERHTISDQALGVLFSLLSLFTALGSILAPRLESGVGGKIRAVVITQALSLLFLLVVGFSPLLWLASVGFLARGALMNMAVPLYDAFSMEQVPESEQATVNSIKNLAWQSGWAIGPFISGFVQASYGFTPLFLATATLYALSIGLTWAFFRNSETIVPAPVYV